MQFESLKRMNESLTLPIIMAPMFLISSPRMVIEASKAGIIGSFPALNARTDDILEDWLKEITTELEKEEANGNQVAPWAIHFNVHRSNKRYQEDLKLIEKYQPPLVITSLGDPSPVVEIVHEYNGLVFSDVINTKFAKKVIEKGGDGLILVSSGAGGHAGSLNPIAFTRAVREFWDGPIILGGGISDGNEILAAQILGANFVYMGSRFIASEESFASDDYKKMLIDATIEDITYTRAISGMNANFLIPSVLRAGIELDQLKAGKRIDFSRSDVKPWRDIWSAGQGVGAIKEIQSVREIVEELKRSYDKALSGVK